MGLNREGIANSFLSNLAVNKKTADNSYSEKPVFCDEGKSLIISLGKSCHLYNTSTGNHVKELFRCPTNIISHHLHPSDESSLIAITENGEATVYNLKMGEINNFARLTLCGMLLNKQKVSIFNSKGEEEKEFDWSKEELNSLANRKFIYAEAKPVSENSPKLLIWASWCLNDEIQAHISIFSLESGKLQHNKVLCKIRLKKCYANFTLFKPQKLNAFAGISHNCMHVARMEKNNYFTTRKHYTGFGNELTCIATHPNDYCIVTGDSIGRIIIWKNIFEKYPLKEIFHWHSWAVRDVAFSNFGNYIFSGGEECVLVKWSVMARKKQLLPRLSSAIRYLSTSAEASLLSVSPSDSKTMILDFNFHCVSTIENFSKWQILRNDKCPRVFTIDPRSGCLVMNGKTGHIQFLSVEEEGKLMYTFDVTNRNYVNSHTTCTISNTEVTHARFSLAGNWLVTAESRTEQNICKESRLKFWKYVEEKSSFALNTNVEFPHGENEIHSLEMSWDGTVATTGPDDKFRLWTVGECRVENAVKEVWSTFCDRKYRHLPCFAVDFSKDSSLVAVTFASILTVWETNTCILKCCLSTPDRKESLKFCKFGNNESTHLIVTGTDAHVSCWNAITLSLLWTVPFELSMLVEDPYSVYMAAFSRNRTLIVFNPASPSPDLLMKNVSDFTVVAAKCGLNVSGKFRLFFLAENQDLYCLDDSEKSDGFFPKPEEEEITGETPFVAQVAQIRNRTDFSSKKVVSVLRNNQTFVTDLLDAPAHTLSNPAQLCSKILRGLLLFSIGKTKSGSRRIEGEMKNYSKKISTEMVKTDAELNEESLMNVVKTIFV